MRACGCVGMHVGVCGGCVSAWVRGCMSGYFYVPVRGVLCHTCVCEEACVCLACMREHTQSFCPYHINTMNMIQIYEIFSTRTACMNDYHIAVSIKTLALVRACVRAACVCASKRACVTSFCTYHINTYDSDLRNLFYSHGIAVSQITSRLKEGGCFVFFPDIKSTNKAIELVHQTMYEGRPLDSFLVRVRLA